MKISHLAVALLAASCSTPSDGFLLSSVKTIASRIWPSDTSPVSTLEAVPTGGNTPNEQSILEAYDNWRIVYNKGGFDPIRYEHFKSNYISLMEANAATIDRARQQGQEPDSLLMLNENGDYSIDEFLALRNGGNPSAGANQVAGPVNGFDNGMSQPKSANNGYNEDDGRIWSAYVDWCNQYGKETNEERFVAFTQNFLAAERQSQATGQSMRLNAFADFRDGFENQGPAGRATGSYLEGLSTPRDSPAGNAYTFPNPEPRGGPLNDIPMNGRPSMPNSAAGSYLDGLNQGMNGVTGSTWDSFHQPNEDFEAITGMPQAPRRPRSSYGVDTPFGFRSMDTNGDEHLAPGQIPSDWHYQSSQQGGPAGPRPPGSYLDGLGGQDSSPPPPQQNSAGDGPMSHPPQQVDQQPQAVNPNQNPARNKNLWDSLHKKRSSENLATSIGNTIISSVPNQNQPPGQGNGPRLMSYWDYTKSQDSPIETPMASQGGVPINGAASGNARQPDSQDAQPHFVEPNMGQNGYVYTGKMNPNARGVDVDPYPAGSEDGRIWKAYKNWCSHYKKETSLERFPAFKNNFIIAEKLSSKNGDKLSLNENADSAPQRYDLSNPSKQSYLMDEPKKQGRFGSNSRFDPVQHTRGEPHTSQQGMGGGGVGGPIYDPPAEERGQRQPPPRSSKQVPKKPLIKKREAGEFQEPFMKDFASGTGSFGSSPSDFPVAKSTAGSGASVSGGGFPSGGFPGTSSSGGGGGGGGGGGFPGPTSTPSSSSASVKEGDSKSPGIASSFGSSLDRAKEILGGELGVNEATLRKSFFGEDTGSSQGVNRNAYGDAPGGNEDGFGGSFGSGSRGKKSLGPTPVGADIDKVWAAYVDWCINFEKEIDDDRFMVFVANFRAEEERSFSTGEKMRLDSTADQEAPKVVKPPEPTMRADNVPEEGERKVIKFPDPPTESKSSEVSETSEDEGDEKELPTELLLEEDIPEPESIPKKSTDGRGATLSDDDDFFRPQANLRSANLGGTSSSAEMTGDERAKAAYEKWCQKFRKSSDHEGFKVFKRNFLAAESYCKETGMDLRLNEFADTPPEVYKWASRNNKEEPPRRPQPPPKPDQKPLLSNEANLESIVGPMGKTSESPRKKLSEGKKGSSSQASSWINEPGTQSSPSSPQPPPRQSLKSDSKPSGEEKFHWAKEPDQSKEKEEGKPKPSTKSSLDGPEEKPVVSKKTDLPLIAANETLSLGSSNATISDNHSIQNEINATLTADMKESVAKSILDSLSPSNTTSSRLKLIGGVASTGTTGSRPTETSTPTRLNIRSPFKWTSSRAKQSMPTAGPSKTADLSPENSSMGVNASHDEKIIASIPLNGSSVEKFNGTASSGSNATSSHLDGFVAQPNSNTTLKASANSSSGAAATKNVTLKSLPQVDMRQATTKPSTITTEPVSSTSKSHDKVVATLPHSSDGNLDGLKDNKDSISESDNSSSANFDSLLNSDRSKSAEAATKNISGVLKNEINEPGASSFGSVSNASLAPSPASVAATPSDNVTKTTLRQNFSGASNAGSFFRRFSSPSGNVTASTISDNRNSSGFAASSTDAPGSDRQPNATVGASRPDTLPQNANVSESRSPVSGAEPVLRQNSSSPFLRSAPRPASVEATGSSIPGVLLGNHTLSSSVNNNTSAANSLPGSGNSTMWASSTQHGSGGGDPVGVKNAANFSSSTAHATGHQATSYPAQSSAKGFFSNRPRSASGNSKFFKSSGSKPKKAPPQTPAVTAELRQLNSNTTSVKTDMSLSGNSTSASVSKNELLSEKGKAMNKDVVFVRGSSFNATSARSSNFGGRHAPPLPGKEETSHDDDSSGSSYFSSFFERNAKNTTSFNSTTFKFQSKPFAPKNVIPRNETLRVKLVSDDNRTRSSKKANTTSAI